MPSSTAYPSKPSALPPIPRTRKEKPENLEEKLTHPKYTPFSGYPLTPLPYRSKGSQRLLPVELFPHSPYLAQKSMPTMPPIVTKTKRPHTPPKMVPELPLEMLRVIISNTTTLEDLAKVLDQFPKQFREFILTSVTTLHLTLEELEILDDLNVLPSLKGLTRLHISNEDAFFKGIDFISKIPGSVKDLSLEYFPSLTWKDLAPLSTQLHHLKLHSCCRKFGKAFPEKPFPNITALSVISTPIPLETMMVTFPHINDLTMGPCSGFHDKDMLALSRSHTKLRRVTLLNAVSLSDKGIDYLCATNDLRFLKVVGSSNLTGRTIHGQNLELLVLNDCTISRSGLADLNERCPRLKTVKYVNSRITNDTTLPLPSMTQLRIVDISLCRGISGVEVESLLDNPLLQRFHGSYLNCFKSEDGSLYSCQELREFKTSYSNIKNTHLKRLKCPRLELLNLGSCKDISDEGLISLLSTNSGSLETIICNETSISNVTLWIIEKYCPRLKKLDIAECQNITEPGFCNTLRSLTDLDISGCNWVTKSTLDEIAKHGRNLRYLHLNDCPNIREEDIAILKEKLSHTKVFH